MIRVLCREILLTLAVLAVLTVAAMVLRSTYGPPTWPHWSLLLQGSRPALGLALRLAGYALLGLCALALLVRLASGWIVLRQLQIPLLTHMAELIHMHQVIIFAGTLRLVLALFGGKDTAAAATAPPRTPPTPYALVRPSPSVAPGREAQPPPHEQDPADSPGQRDQPAARHPRVHRPARAVRRVPALIYTVQRGDTLSLIAEHLYGNAARYTRIFQASRGVRQDDGGMLASPGLIRPGWHLQVPLPVLHLSVSGNHALYVVQPGDSESAIAAWFLGDWRRYIEIDHLSRGVRQPDGEMLENPNLIQPGWILRLPLDGRLAQAPLPVRLKRGLMPHHAPRPRRAAVAPPKPATTPRTMSRTQPVTIHPHPSAPASPPVSHQQPPRQESRQQGNLRRPGRPVEHSRHVHPLLPVHATPPGLLRPKRHVHPRRPSAGRAHAETGARPPVLVRPPHPVALTICPAPQRPPIAAPPIVRLPDSDRLLPLTLVLALLGLCALVARRRVAGGLPKGPIRAGWRVALSMQRALLAVRTGAHGLLERRLYRAATTTRGQGNVVAHVLAALDADGAQAGVPVHLARLIRRVTEDHQTVGILIEARRMDDDLLARVVDALRTTLGTSVQASRRMASDGMPCAQLTLRRAGLAAGTKGWGPGHGRPHPAPLLVPVGHTDGTVLHLNLGRRSATLIVGGTQGTDTLVATLLASSVIQAYPGALRLLVAISDDDLRGMLPVLEHLEAPPVVAGDVPAMAALVDRAYTVVVDRFTVGEAEPADPAYLVVLDGVESLCADRRALDRLDVICRNGHLCGVHVLATTSDPALLKNEGLLASFPTRLLRRLGPEESTILCGDARATALDARELLVQEGDQAPEQVSLFTLTIPEVRELWARLATLLASEAVGPGPGTPTADASAIQTKTSATGTISPKSGALAATAVLATPPDKAIGQVTRAGQADAVTTSPDAGSGRDVDGEATSPDQSVVNTEGALPAPATPGSEAATGSGEPNHTVPARHGDERQAANVSATRTHAASPVPPIVLNVFGQITASVGATEIALERQHKRVLAALAIMGPKRVRGERLYNALFRDMPDEQANRLLITTMSALRRRLRQAAGLSKTHDPDPILHDSGGYSLNPLLVWVDSRAFQDLLARSQEKSMGTEERGRLLAQAVDLYRGDLCGDQEMEWLLDVIPAWRRQYLDALAELATYYADIAADPVLAERTARRLVYEEPTVAPYTHLLMRVLAAHNDEPGVRQAYREHRSALIALETDDDDEEDSAPTELEEESLRETEELYERLSREIRDRRAETRVSKAG